ncbi:MAG: class I SAM-dependent methyltransferase [Sedimenticola sp.]
MLHGYFKSLYRRTMREAYALAQNEIGHAMKTGGDCLDCGAGHGHMYDHLYSETGLTKDSYYGIEWNNHSVEIASKKDLSIIQCDLNKRIPHPDNRFNCIFGLSILEHLMNPCRYLNECYRVLDKGGTLIIFTPNISTYFTAALILAGRMPSSGPHPDSDRLLRSENLFKVSSELLQHDTEQDMPAHRHLVVFSYSVLKTYLNMQGFRQIKGYGFGLYPFPNFMQPALEKIDPYHCHQMVFIAQK